MLSTTDALFFSNLAYHGPDSGSWYAGQLAAIGADQQGWAYLSQAASNPDSYFGVAFENQAAHEIVIANRGSGSLVDWGETDWDIVHHQPNIPAFADALVFADAVTSANSAFSTYVTGHSLGGAEAQYQAAELGLSGTVFAAPGMAWMVPGKTAAVTDYVFVGDPIGNRDSPVGSRVTIYPDGPIEFHSVDASLAIDAALVATGHPVLAAEARLILLHLIGNDLEHFGLLQNGVGPVAYPGAISPVEGLLLALFLPAPLGGAAAPALAADNPLAIGSDAPNPFSLTAAHAPTPLLTDLADPDQAIAAGAPTGFDFAGCSGPERHSPGWNATPSPADWLSHLRPHAR